MELINACVPPVSSPRSFGRSRRKSVRVSRNDLVEVRPLIEGSTLPLLIEPAAENLDLLAWGADNQALLDAQLAKHGGILFRNFKVEGIEAFEDFSRTVSSELLEYKERSSPRSQVKGNIYTSTDYPADQPIFLHNENSYQKVWPMKIFFYCHINAEVGGETPVADCRSCYRKIDPEVRRRFAEKGWMYVRNFGDGFGLPWETVFQTSDRSVVETHCRRSGITFEWKSGNRLRTRAVRQAIATHPKTGENVWFNHATFFHVTTLPAAQRQALLAEFTEEDLPANTYYGDGTPIETDVLDHLREVYDSETMVYPWQQGDVLMLDNMMVAHARQPFKGKRKVLVSMAEPCTWDDISTAEAA